jgi:hypothetical protein
MYINPKSFFLLLAALMVTSLQTVHAQNQISWLDDYTGEMLIGSDTYSYNFTSVEGNDCKYKFEEELTDKKGSTKVHSWVFYLSDIDPSTVSFKAKGKSIGIFMETHQSRKFISYYEDGELDGYTEKIGITMDEVDKTRSFIEAIKTNISNCKETEATWENQDQAFTWLVDNVRKATDGDTEWDQEFESGSRSYLLNFQASSVSAKGEQESFSFSFDLNDINPKAINLKISGKSLIVEVPIKESKRLIKLSTASGTEFSNKMLIYSNEIEQARQIVNALIYMVSNVTSERQTWDTYGASLEFVKANSAEVKIGEELFSNSISYEESSSGLVNLEVNFKSDGNTEKTQYAFYLTDMASKLELEVSKTSITVEMLTKNKRKYVREHEGGIISAYSSSVDFHVTDIDLARDIIKALEQAIGFSEENINEFNNIGEVSTWFSENIALIKSGGDSYEQTIRIESENENQLTIDRKLTESDEKSTETRFILYPEDISLDDLEILVSGKKLSVPLKTAKGKYIKKFENGLLQNFTGNTEILFSDPLVAKNFMAAIRFLQENSVSENRAYVSKDEVLAFLSENIQAIKLPDNTYEQKIEFKDGGTCKMSFTRVETNSKGSSDEYSYEFNVSDIHPGNSKFSVKGKIISINLVTAGNEKLVKPYKNGEAGDFVDDFVIYADDVLLAKSTLAAFEAVSEMCK